MTHPQQTPDPGPAGRGSFFALPSTRLGRWAAGLMAAFVVMFLINSFVFMRLSSDAPWQRMLLPFYGIGMLACGLAAGITGVIAIVRRGERSWLVWPAVLPCLWVIFMLLGEFLFPH